MTLKHNDLKRLIDEKLASYETTVYTFNKIFSGKVNDDINNRKGFKELATLDDYTVMYFLEEND